MVKQLSKLLSGILVLAMVFSSVHFYGTSVNADVTTEQMIASASYNLMLGKKVEAFPSCEEGNTEYLTDGQFTVRGNYAATTFRVAGTYYQIDLGAAYDASTLDRIVIGYKENSDGDTPVKGYEIQFSANGIDFETVKKVEGQSVKDAWNDSNYAEVETLDGMQGAVRYIKLYYPDSYEWGIQVTEIAVLDTNGDAAIAEVEKCDDAAGVSVSSQDYNAITYHITAGPNQEGYKYIVYLDDVNLIGMGVEAGKDYTVTGINAGSHTIKVIAAYDGKASTGIISEPVRVADISELIQSKRNITNKNNNSLVEISSVSEFYAGHTLATSQVIVDGSIKSGEGTDVALRTTQGSPKYFVIDLGDYYTPSEMEKAFIAYSNPRTYASDTQIAFSLDGDSYTTVATKTGYSCQKDNQGTADLNEVALNKIANYTEKAVRFVKVTLSNGSTDYGYVINEFSLIANTENPTIVGSNIPEAADIQVDTQEMEKIKYTIIAGENQTDAVYMVKFGAEIINNNAKAGVEYEYEGIEAGTYEIKVSTIENGWMSKGITKTVTIDGYINYIMDSLNLAYTKYHSNVIATCDADNKTDYLDTSQEISAGVWALNNGVYTDHAHHTGYLQTRPDRETVNIGYDLGKDYNPNDIYSVISMYEGSGNAATEYEIFFSATGEEESYERVFYAKDVIWKQFLNDKVDVSNYSQDTVRFIKYRIITGNYGRYVEGQYGSDGYHLCELAVMGKESLRPEPPKNVAATSPEYNSLTVTWEDAENPDITYNIYIDGTIYGLNIPSGINEKTYSVPAGTHSVFVSSKWNDIEHNSEEVIVTVEEETTTPPPTTERASIAPTTEEKHPTASEKNTHIAVTSTTEGKDTDYNAGVNKPGRTKITKVKPGRKKVSIKFKKVKKATGYRIQYSLKKNFKKAKSVTTSKPKITIKKLKRGKRYYFRVQAYINVKGNRVYGKYSKKVRSKKIH